MKFDIRRIIEIVWLALAAICTVEFVISFRQIGLEGDTLIYLFVTVISLVMYFIRRRGRKAFNRRDGKEGEMK